MIETSVDPSGSNVQVTLQILSAIIDKAPRDLNLYANSVLTILTTVLGSKDINMVEESIPTFESYCKHADVASLAADQGRSKQYRSIIQQYAQFASVDASANTASTQSVPVNTRRRTIALKAIRAVVGSDALGVETSEQLNIVMPVILENLDLEKGGSLASLHQKATTGEKQSSDLARRRRMSSATVPTIDELVDSNPAMASETVADADKLAEEEVRVLAIRCLKHIFSISTGTSRTQMRLATALTLRFITTKERPRPNNRSDSVASLAPDWANTLFETIARWTPVQDRFIIVITTVETLVRSPIVESILEKQLMLASLVDWLLRSDINLIGLSVMDVLLRLVEHTLLLLQLGSRDSDSRTQAQQADVFGLYREIQETYDPAAIATEPERGRVPDAREKTPSLVRRELLGVLQKCISDLATHIYYTDQISDMITAIMARLKPSTTSEMPNATAAVNDPAGATKAIAESGNLQEDSSTDGFFSFTTARIIALKAVKEILVTANSRRTGAGTSAEVRSRVGVQVWEGTQWLLKDDDPEVRAAYIDAVVNWLRLETNKVDLLLPSNGLRKAKTSKRDAVSNGEISIAKRAVSNASRREPKPTKSTFLQLLHLAIYDNAIERSNSDQSILLLFLLMWTMIERLGVNSLRSGLPMILNLQNDVLNDSTIYSPEAKTRIASLVHGYLWAIADKFDLEGTPVGQEINTEISRRKRFGCWFDKIRFPATNILQIVATNGSSEKHVEPSKDAVDAIRPFLNVNALVDEIAVAYDRSLVSPASSPPSSPGRVFSVPTLGFGYGYNAAPVHKPSPQDQLPQRIKDEMCGNWSREACIASIDKESNPSLAGSRTAASSTGRQHLSTTQKHESGTNSPQNAEPPNLTFLGSGLGSLSKARNFSTTSSFRDPETSSRDSTMRVSDLKQALAGNHNDLRGHSPLRGPLARSRQSTRSSGSESMVSWNPADDDSFIEVPPADGNVRPATAPTQGTAPYYDQATAKPSRPGDTDIPPVPKIPSALNLPMAGTYPRDSSPARKGIAQQTPSTGVTTGAGMPPRPDTSSMNTIGGRAEKQRRRPASRAGGASVWSHSTTSRKADLSQLLASIQTDALAVEENRKTIVGNKVLKPPY